VAARCRCRARRDRPRPAVPRVDPLLLSALGVAWFAVVVALYTRRDALPSRERGSRRGGAFAGLTTYVTVTLQQSLSVPLPQAFAAALTALGLACFAAGAGSIMTVCPLDGA